MDMKLNFFGAAQNVTGSCYLLESGGRRIMVDCGLYQERDLKSRNWDPFPVPPASIDAVLLTHAHLDHCGRLPLLVKQGFQGKIYCTAATAEITQIILLDSAHIQEEDVAHKKERHEREGRESPYPLVPLYTTEDVEAVRPLLAPVPYETYLPVAEGLEASFHEAGHIFGSAMIRVRATQGSETRTVLFSGDVGRKNLPIIEDPATFDEADYVLVESTYGDRRHGRTADIPDELAGIVNRTIRGGGNIVIPSFAVERTQELLYHLHGLRHDKRIPPVMVFVDSPMAIRVTDVFMRHEELFDEETRALLRQGRHPCDFSGLVLTRTAEQSKAINRIKGSCIIIAGSGMCTGGRVKHHLANNIARPESTVLFVGYQAHGTLGRAILEKTDPVRILGEMHELKARVERIDGFSAHADRDELMAWLTALKKPPRRVFITHGETEVAKAFALHVAKQTGWNTFVPEYEGEVALD